MDNEEYIKKLKILITESKDFDENEVELLKRFIEAYRGWIVVGRFGKLVLVTLTAIATGAVAWDTAVKTVKSWLV